MANTNNTAEAKLILNNALEYFERQPETLTPTQTYQHVLGAVEAFLNSGKRKQAFTLALEYAKDTKFSMTFVPPLDPDDSE